MKAQNFKSLILVLVFLFAGYQLYSQELEKNIHKEFNPNNDTKLVVKNQFGDITIQDWDKQNIVVDISIITKAGSEETAKNMQEKINVEINSSDSIIELVTLIDKHINGTGIFKSSHREFSINYTISVPRNLKMDIYNKYGDVVANELHGKSDFTVKFGNFKANKLIFNESKPLSKVIVSYGNCTINECNWLSCIISFSKLNITDAKALVVVSKYSTLEFTHLFSGVIESSFDKYQINEISSIVFKSKYTDMTIDKLKQKARFDSKFGDINLENIANGFDSINIVGKYVDFELFGEKGSTFYVQGNLRFGDIDFPKYTNLEQHIKETTVEFKGLVGPGEGTESHIDIDASFGDIKIK